MARWQAVGARRRYRQVWCGTGMLLALLLAACHTPPNPPPPAPAPTAEPAPASTLTPPTPAGEPFAIDAEQSDIRLFVRRDGTMAALGHNHVIAIGKLQGTVHVTDDLQQSQLELHFPVAELRIDEPAMRAAAGADYQSIVNDAARTGTRTNMLGARLLQAAMFPEIRVTSGAIAVTAPGQLRVQLQMTVRDHQSVLEVPVQWRRAGDTLQADSSFSLQHEALGLTPYSVAMGAIRVAGAIEVHCHIVARHVH
jgi:polyisoprenoid-binding protein YceI